MFLFWVSVCLSAPVHAYETNAAGTDGAEADAAGAVEQPERDPLGRSTPKGAVIGFLRAIDGNNDNLAADYLDLRNLPPRILEYKPEQLARGLSIVLQRGTWIDLERLSEREEGLLADDLPSYRDLLVELPTRKKPIQILLQRVPDGDGGRIWKFSNSTIAELDILYEEYRYNRFVEWLEGELPDVSFLTIELFKWVTALAAIAAFAPVVLLLAWWLSRFLIAPDNPLHVTLRRFLLGPFTVFVLVLIGDQVLLNLGAGLAAQEIARTYTVVTAVTIWLLWQSVNLFRDVYGQRLQSRGRESSVPLLRPMASAMKVIVLLLGLLVWLDNMGYEITAVLTGLGIGGIAVALVLQKPLEDVFGALTLYTQQPVKIGDFGRFGEITGTVEEISLRTTRIRTLGNSLVSVPNMKLASEPIENLSARQKFLFQPVLQLSNQASAEVLGELLDALRGVLEENDRVIEEGMRVRFTAITLFSFDVSLFAYIDADDWAHYLAIAESLNLEILDVLARSNVSLASPMESLVTPVQ